MPSEVLLEVCVETVASAIAAERGGAHRIRLCSNLAVEGVTPNPALIEQVRQQVAIPLHVLIRPRADFHYTAIEFEVIRNEIRQAKHLGADGLVLVLSTQVPLSIMSGTRELVKLARPLSVTFHQTLTLALICRRHSMKWSEREWTVY
jgi:copper homeostasis protein